MTPVEHQAQHYILRINFHLFHSTGSNHSNIMSAKSVIFQVCHNFCKTAHFVANKSLLLQQSLLDTVHIFSKCRFSTFVDDII